MMAIADAEYKFLAADTGSQGRNNDVVVLQESGLGKKLLSETFGLPGEKEIKYGPVLPHFLLGDEIFGLKPYLMVPYPGRTHYSLSCYYVVNLLLICSRAWNWKTNLHSENI